MAGTTNEKLELLRQTKADLKAALTEKGQTPGDVFADYPDMVRAISGGGGEQATPEIDVSEGGLITATAGDKTATEQLPTEPGKTVNAGSAEKVVVQAGKFVTGDIKVGAVVMDGANVSGVTADKNDVREFKVFVDADGNEKVGTQPTRTASDLIVRKRHVTVPAGIYDAQTELEVEPVVEYQPQPAAWSRVHVGGNTSVLAPTDIGIESDVIFPSGVRYYYNHEFLPELPLYALSKFPYACIIRQFNYSIDAFYLVLSATPGKIETKNYRFVAYGAYMLFACHAGSNGWHVVGAGQSSNTSYTHYAYYNMIDKQTDTDYYPIWWSNYDICIDDTDEVYWKAKPVLSAKPADPEYCYYGGVKLPRVPDEILEAYPYSWIRYNTGYNRYDLICSDEPVWYSYNSGNNSYIMYRSTTATSPVQIYSINRTALLAGEDVEWVFNAESTQTGSWSSRHITADSYPILWWSYPIPNSSATNTTICYYYTPATPV